MAVKINSGDLNRKITFFEPSYSLNDEGGLEKNTYTEAFAPWAAVKETNQFRTTEPDATALLNSKDFFIRYSSERLEITKDWILNYDDKDFTIHEIQRLEEDKRFMRITGKVKGQRSANATGGSGGDGGGGGGVHNFSDVSFDDLDGVLTFTGDPGAYKTEVQFKNIPVTEFGYVNAEGQGYSIGLFDGASTSGVEFITPGDVVIMWRRVTNSGSPVTAWASKTITVTRLQRRWLTVWRVAGNAPIGPGFLNLKVYNIYGVVTGLASGIDELVTLWNGDADDAAFGQIIDKKLSLGTSGFYMVRIEPLPDKLVFPTGSTFFLRTDY